MLPEPKVHYWSLVEPIWRPLNRSWDDGSEGFVRLFRSLRPELGHLYAAHWCQSEVRNGGFHQFFSNTTGLLAPEALDGFRAIGVAEWAEILAEAMQFFGSPYPRERDDRQELLSIPQQDPREDRDPFYRLDDRFYEWTERWEEAADAYAVRVEQRTGGIPGRVQSGENEGFTMSFTMEDFKRELFTKYFTRLTKEERREALERLSPQQRKEVLEALPAAERLAGLPLEDRLAALSAEEIRQYLDRLTADHPARPRKPRRKR